MVYTKRGIIEGVVEVKHEIKCYFENFFKESNSMRPTPDGLSFKKMSTADSLSIEEPFKEEEIKVAIWSCDGEKSDGLDGPTLDFFKKNWEVVTKDLFHFVWAFSSLQDWLRLLQLLF